MVGIFVQQLQYVEDSSPLILHSKAPAAFFLDDPSKDVGIMNSQGQRSLSETKVRHAHCLL